MRAMFSTVAPRYDFITRTFSYGMDKHWKRTGFARADLPERPVVLDLASGTGDFSLMVKEHYPGSRAVAVAYYAWIRADWYRVWVRIIRNPEARRGIFNY